MGYSGSGLVCDYLESDTSPTPDEICPRCREHNKAIAAKQLLWDHVFLASLVVAWVRDFELLALLIVSVDFIATTWTHSTRC